MNWVDKSLIFLTSVILAVLGIMVFLTSSGMDFHALATETMEFLSQTGKAAGYVIGLTLIAIAFYIAGRWLGGKKETELVIDGEYGQVLISEDVLKAYANCAAEDVDGISEVKSSVKMTEDGLRVDLNIKAKPDARVTETAKIAQVRVSELVADSMGIKVATVVAKITAIASEARPRIRN